MSPSWQTALRFHQAGTEAALRLRETLWKIIRVEKETNTFNILIQQEILCSELCG